MSERLDPNTILPNNPKVDPDELEAAREMLRRLRDHGSQRKGYDLLPAFGGYRVTVRDDARTDARIVRLRPTPDAV